MGRLTLDVNRPITPNAFEKARNCGFEALMTRLLIALETRLVN